MAAAFDEEYMFSRMKKVGAYYEENLCDCAIPESIKKKVSRSLIMNYHLLPVRMENDTLIIVTDSERAFKVKNMLKESVGHPVRLMVTDKDNLKMGILKHYGISLKLSNSVAVIKPPITKL